MKFKNYKNQKWNVKVNIKKIALLIPTLLVLLSTISVPVSASGDHNIINYSFKVVISVRR